ncbi:MAG: Uncharacterised protein [Cryomorphaceae bacterium]|nr:MAG: Uncharacterised protein [Cryomorphaceae bacterium]
MVVPLAITLVPCSWYLYTKLFAVPTHPTFAVDPEAEVKARPVGTAQTVGTQLAKSEPADCAAVKFPNDTEATVEPL